MPAVCKVSDGEREIGNKVLVWGGGDKLMRVVVFKVPLVGPVGNAQWASALEVWKDLA